MPKYSLKINSVYSIYMIRQYAFCFAFMYTTGISSFILYQHIESRQKLIEQAKITNKYLKKIDS